MTRTVPTLTHLGEFRLLRPLGRGGMGVVYEAQQESLGRHVALKVLPPGASAVVRERFRREARVAASLHHSHIVPVYGVGSDHGTDFFAMQFIAGQPLNVVLRDVRALRVGTSTAGPDSWDSRTRHDYYRNTARLALQAADALAYAHGQGVIHRDVKPANLLLDTAGHLWLSDFGLAKDDYAADLTAPGDVVGTLRYLAPECFDGAATAAGDIYALGATLYELLALRPAFDAPERAGLVLLIEEGRPTPLRQLDPSIPRDLETVAHKALAASPRDRYASAAALADDLRRFLADEPVQARPLSALGQLGRWVKRNRSIAALAVALAVSLLGGGIVAGVGWWRAEQLRQQAEAQERESAGSKRAMFAAVDRYFTRVSDSRLLNEPGSDKLRAELLGDARTFFERYAREHADDAEARWEFAQALVRVAEMTEKTEPVEARLARWRQAQAARRLLAQQQPDDRDSMDWFGRALLGTADAANATGAADELSAALSEAEAVYERLTALPAETADELSVLAKGWKALGRTFHLREQYEPAARAYRRALAAHDRLVELEPTDARRVQRAATRTFHWVVGHRTGAARALVGEMQATIAELRAALDRDPRSFQTRIVLANALNSLSQVAHGGDWVAADKLSTESLGLRARTLAEHPDRTELRRELADAAHNLGFLRFNLRLLPASDEAHTLAEQNYAELVRADPNNSKIQEERAGNFCFWGNTRLLLGRPAEARELLEQGLTLQRPLLFSSIRAETNRRYIAHFCALRAVAYGALPGGPTEARTMLADLDEAASLGRAVEHRDSRTRAIAYARLGRLAAAATEADELLQRRPRLPVNTYLAAYAFAAIAHEAAGPTWERRLLAEAAARRAGSLFRQALAEGVFKNPGRRSELRGDVCHTVLRGRSDFAQLERDIDASALDPTGVLKVTLLAESAPARLGDFRLLRQVGRGGMGIVYEAIQESLSRHVALKVLPPGASAVVRERFRREARVAARLHHSHIVPVYGVGRADDIDFFAMQFISGQPLSAVLREVRGLRDGSSDAGPDSWASRTRSDYYRNAARLALQAAEALAYAHRQGVIHRDVKPANLLLDTSGQLWLSDFGLAKDTEADALTATGNVVGTLRYLAPERFRSDATPASDIYALGATLYELLALRPLFDAPERAGLVTLIEASRPTPLRRLDPGIPRDLETIAHKALAASPGDRYATADDLAADLRRYLADEPVQARPLSSVGRGWRWAKRHRATAALALLLAGSMFGGSLTAGVGWWRAEQRRQEAEFHERESAAIERAMFAAVEHYFTRVSESRLLNEPGSEQLRAQLLDDARGMFARYVTAHAADPQAAREHALALFRLAELTGSTAANESARRAWEAALAAWTGEARAAPADPSVILKLGCCWDRLAGLHQQNGAHAASSAASTAAAAEFTRVLALTADGQTGQAARFTAFQALGQLHMRQRDYATANGFYRQAVTLGQKLSAVEPDFLRQLADVRSDLVTNLNWQSDWSATLPEIEALLAERTALLSQEPYSFELRQALTRALVQHGRVCSHLGRLAAAEESYERAAALDRALVAAHPGLAKVKHRLAEHLSNQAFNRQYLRRYPAADSAVAESGQLYAELLRGDPTNPTYRAGLADAHMLHGHIALILLQPAVAHRAFDEALALFQPIADQEAGYQWVGNLRQQCYAGRAWARALAPERDAAAVHRDLDAAVAHGWPFAQRDHHARAVAHAWVGNWASALADAAAITTVRPRLPATRIMSAFAYGAIAATAREAPASWERQVLAEFAARQAVAVLRELHARRVFADPVRMNELRGHPHLQVLRDRPDFRQLAWALAIEAVAKVMVWR